MNVCPICMKSICNICTLECSHSFCYKCIEKWIYVKENCPVCRSYISIQDEQKKVRLTRSMTRNIRAKKIKEVLDKIINDLDNIADNELHKKNKEINMIFNLFHENIWLFKCMKNLPPSICDCVGCRCKQFINRFINEISEENLKEIHIWRYKFRNYLN